MYKIYTRCILHIVYPIFKRLSAFVTRQLNKLSYNNQKNKRKQKTVQLS